MKKSAWIISLIIIALFLTSMAYATTYSEGYFYYVVEDDAITITGYFGREETVEIPNQIAGSPVSKIASGAFEGVGVKELHLPDTIMEIEENAIPEGVKVYFDFGDEGEKLVTPERNEADDTVEDEPDTETETDDGVGPDAAEPDGTDIIEDSEEIDPPENDDQSHLGEDHDQDTKPAEKNDADPAEKKSKVWIPVVIIIAAAAAVSVIIAGRKKVSKKLK